MWTDQDGEDQRSPLDKTIKFEVKKFVVAGLVELAEDHHLRRGVEPRDLFQGHLRPSPEDQDKDRAGMMKVKMPQEDIKDSCMS